MKLLLIGPNGEGWLAYITRGHYVMARARTQDEAWIKLLKKIQKLGLPPPDAKAFERNKEAISTTVQTPSTTDKRPDK